MASWHENQYQNFINNVNLNEPEEILLDGFQDQFGWTQFYRSNHHLDQHQRPQNSFANVCIVLTAMPTPQMPARVGISMRPMERTTFTAETGMEPMSRAQEDREETMDRKEKRIIKNRESSARSRARKLGYKNELENKVARLEEELNRLKQQKLSEQEKEEAASLTQDSNGAPIRRANSVPY